MGSGAWVSAPYRGTEQALRRNDGVGDRMMRKSCVYMLASRRNGTLYIGATSNLAERVWQHKRGLVEGFTKRYGVHMLVWYEVHETMGSAVARERALKEWNRAWKLRLIEESNPKWEDLYDSLG